MNTTRTWIGIAILVIVIAVLWFSLDHRYVQEPALVPITTASSTVQQITIVPQQSAQQGASASSTSQTSSSSSMQNFSHTVTVTTTKGVISFETYDADAPNTVKNFLTLTDKGFYNGTIFHRVIEGFMIQGGDPTGTGMGGPGYKFADELDPATPSYKAGYVRGTVAMANAGPNTNGSQFFIMQKDQALPHSYTIFGKVISGMDVVDAIAASQTGQNDKPVQPITMTAVTEKAK